MIPLVNQGRSRNRNLVGIEEVGTVLVGIPVRGAIRLQINRKTVRAFAGITNDLGRTRESAAYRARREPPGPVVAIRLGRIMLA